MKAVSVSLIATFLVLYMACSKCPKEINTINSSNNNTVTNNIVNSDSPVDQDGMPSYIYQIKLSSAQAIEELRRYHKEAKIVEFRSQLNKEHQIWLFCQPAWCHDEYCSPRRGIAVVRNRQIIWEVELESPKLVENYYKTLCCQG